MKIQIITIEGDCAELASLLKDFYSEEFRVKIAPKKRDIAAEAVEAMEQAGKAIMAGIKNKADVPVKDIIQFETKRGRRPKEGKPEIKKMSRDKECAYCGKKFHDDSRTNTRIFCSEDCKKSRDINKKNAKPEPIEKTLAEIEQARQLREKEPYKFEPVINPPVIDHSRETFKIPAKGKRSSVYLNVD